MVSVCLPSDALSQDLLSYFGFSHPGRGESLHGCSSKVQPLLLTLDTLHYCSGFCHTLIWISHGCTCVPHPEHPSHLPPYPIPQGHTSAPALSTLSHASNLDWLSVSHMIIYMFQCYSLKSSHPYLLPQSPKVCSLHLYLFHCLAYRVIVTIFLDSIYALIYCIGVSLSDLLHSI